MTEIEQLRAMIGLQNLKISGLSSLVEGMRRRMDDWGAPSPIRDAGAVAVEIHLDPAIATTPIEAHKGERAKLAKELRRRGWSINRIAQGLSCCEKSVERYLKI